MASSKLLLAAKSLSVDPGAANAKNLLAAAARYEIIQLNVPLQKKHMHNIFFVCVFSIVFLQHLCVNPMCNVVICLHMLLHFHMWSYNFYMGIYIGFTQNMFYIVWSRVNFLYRFSVYVLWLSKNICIFLGYVCMHKCKFVVF